MRSLPGEACYLGSPPVCHAIKVQKQTIQVNVKGEMHCPANRFNCNKLPTSYVLPRCAKCRLPYYCGVVCQRAAWKLGHKVECKYLSSVAPRVPPSLVLLLLRTLQRASINPAYKETLPEGSRGLKDLMSHEKQIEKTEERREAFLAYLPVIASCVGEKYTQADLWMNYCRYVSKYILAD